MKQDEARYKQMLKEINQENAGRRLFSDRPHRKTNYFRWFVIGVLIFGLAGMVVFIEFAQELDDYFSHEALGLRRRSWLQFWLVVIVLFPLCFRFVRNKLFR